MRRWSVVLSVRLAFLAVVRLTAAAELIDLPLNGSLNGTVQGKPVAAQALGETKFVPGRDGDAIRFDGKGAVSLPIGDCWPVREGCVEFWVKPMFRGGDNRDHWLACDDLTRFRLFKYTNGHLYFQVQCDDRGVNCAARCPWLPDEWHHVAFAWRNFNSGKDDGVMMLYSDGQLLATATGEFQVSKVGQTLLVGSGRDGANGAQAIISGVHVRDAARVEYRPKRGEIAAHNPDDYALSALGASVKASSEIKSFRGKAFLAANLIDGRESGEYWCTDFPNGAKPPHWAEVDLSADRLVGRVIVYAVKRPGAAQQDFRIEGWVDGEWKVLAKEGGTQDMRDSGPRAKYARPSGVVVADLEPPATLRKIRLFSGADALRLYEIEVLPPPQAPAQQTVSLAEAGPLLRFDFGMASSPTEPGWISVCEQTKYSPEQGYGWQDSTGLIGVDRLEGYPITRDLVAGVAEGKPAHHTFTVRLPDGRYAVAVMAGDLSDKVGPFRISADGKEMAKRVGTGDGGGWDAQTFVAEVADGALELTFDAEESWAVSAVIVAPADRFAEVRQIVEGIEDAFAKRSPALLKGYCEHRPVEPAGDLAVTDERRARGYEVFAPKYVRQIFPTTIPNENDVARQVRLAATPGEYEPASVAIRTLKPLRDVRVTASDLRGPDVIPADRIAVDIVRCWPQIEERWGESEYMVVPELIEPQGRHGELWVGANATKQFWLTVHVPDDAKPGEYRGALMVSAADAPPTELVMALDVLPFRLRSPKPMSLGIYYHPREEEGEGRTLADLRNMRSHGLNAIAFDIGRDAVVKKENGVSFDLGHVRWVMDLLRKAGGFEGPFPLYMSALGAPTPENREAVRGFITAMEAERAKQGWPEVLYYPVDEPFAGEKLESAIAPYQACKQVPSIRTYCTVSGLAAQALGPWLDVRCHTLTAANGFVWPKVWEDAVKDGDEFWWYSNATRHYPDIMRLKAGFFHWKVKATGQTYWHYCAPCASAFCDFDATSRDHEAVYPGLDGPIGTIQWECQREGLDDAKYVWTLESVIAEAEKAGRGAPAVAKARQVLDDLRQKVNVDMDSYDKKHPFRRYAFHYFCEWKPEDFDDARSRVAAAIIEVVNAGAE